MIWPKLLNIQGISAFTCGLWSTGQSSGQRFQTLPLTVGSGNKSATKLSLKIPPLLERVATLPCEISDARLTDSDQRSDFFAPPCTVVHTRVVFYYRNFTGRNV